MSHCVAITHTRSECGRAGTANRGSGVHLCGMHARLYDEWHEHFGVRAAVDRILLGRQAPELASVRWQLAGAPA